MTTERTHIQVSGMPVEVIRKDIKHLHLAVYPPNGRVRVAAPRRLDDEAVRLAVVARIGWIRRRQRGFRLQDRQSKREFVTGESHFFRGRRYRLQVLEDSHVGVRISGKRLELHVRASTDASKREQIVNDWYRRELKGRVPALLEKWEPVVGVAVSSVGIKRMKTRWGSCNGDARRVWLNLELAKKPLQCLEYVLVHELVHCLEAKHNDRFKELMDGFMLRWRLHRDELNGAPLAHEDWSY